MSTQTIRQSTILISAGKRTSVYSSLDQVPPALKHQLMASTSGANSATILLADRAGREEIVRALRGMPSHIQSRLMSPKLPWTEAFARKQAAPRASHAARGTTAESVPLLKARNRSVWRRIDLRAAAFWARERWPELLLPVGVAIGLWALLAT